MIISSPPKPSSDDDLAVFASGPQDAAQLATASHSQLTALLETDQEETCRVVNPTKRLRRKRSWLSLPPSSFDPDYDGRSLQLSHPVVWLALALAASLIGQSAALYFFHNAYAGAQTWTCSLLFTLCGLGGIVYPAFQRHARDSWQRPGAARGANVRLALNLSMLFLGVACGYALLPLLMGVTTYGGLINGADELLRNERSVLAHMHFHGVAEIWLHNIRVFTIFLLVGLIFRYLGILFVIIYNASLWGLLYAGAIEGSLFAEETTGWQVLGFVLCMVPHVIGEIAAYVIAAMAGVFFARLISRYRLLSPKLIPIAQSILFLVGVGLVVLTAAALIEGLVADYLSDLVFHQPVLH